MCRSPGSTSGVTATHTWAAATRDVAAAVRQVSDDSSGTYGSPRMADELREQGWRVSDNTFAAVMAELGLVARARRRRRGLTRPDKRIVVMKIRLGRVRPRLRAGGRCAS